LLTKMLRTTDIPVIILCGGKGTRLKEKTINVPKPLIEIGNKPILWHILRIYQSQGFSNFILACGYKWTQFKKFAKQQGDGINIQVVDTGEETRKGGRVFLLKDYVKNSIFMCTYGDGVSNINLNKLLEFHNRKKKIVTITCVKPRNQYGIVNINNGVVESFVEKPKMKEWVNAGFFVFNSNLFEHMSENCGLEDEVFPGLAKKRQVVAYKHTGFWASMDTHKDFQDLNKLWYTKKAEWKVW